MTFPIIYPKDARTAYPTTISTVSITAVPDSKRNQYHSQSRIPPSQSKTTSICSTRSIRLISIQKSTPQSTWEVTMVTSWSLVTLSETKLLQKSEMRKNMVMDLIYRGFIYAANYSESHFNPRRSQIKTELRYLFVTTLNR